MATCAFKKEEESARSYFDKNQARIIAFKDDKLAEVHESELTASKKLDIWFASLDSIAQLRKEIKEGTFCPSFNSE